MNGHPEISIEPGWSTKQHFVIPAKAGIQRNRYLPRKRDNVSVLSASRGISPHWIPAFAGMTGYWIIWVEHELTVGRGHANSGDSPRRSDQRAYGRIKAICASASVTRSKVSSNDRPIVLHSWKLPTQLYGLGARQKERDFRPGSTGTCFDAARIPHVVLDAQVHPVACFHALDPEGDKWIF